METSQAEGGTRSGLLWEVERILNEIYIQHQKDHIDYLPILLMENVPEVQGSGNLPHFIKWCEKLESLGYDNFFQILNAKDYGIPQNRRRCYMISIKKGFSYDFPLKTGLKYKLGDFLEDKVDEKYYLSDKDIERISQWKSQESPLDNAIDIERERERVMPTLTARGAGEEHAGMKLLIFPNQVNVVGNYGSGHHAKDIVSSEGVSATITIGNHGIGQSIAIKENNSQGYKMANVGDGVNLAGRMAKQRGNVQKGSIQTLKAQMEIGVVVDDEEHSKEWRNKFCC